MRKSLNIALVQFDARPEQADRNLRHMRRLMHEAAEGGAELVMFHEGTLTDYTPRVEALAQPVPAGPACRSLERLAARLRIYVSFGLSEVDRDRHYITQVFIGPHGFLYRYRKTWLYRTDADEGYRNEIARYDPGTGPEPFEIAGLRATCFICADGSSPRCLSRARAIRPQVVFHPKNHSSPSNSRLCRDRARAVGAPMLATNRVGRSWIHDCLGGCVVYDGKGRELALANCEGREEILHHRLRFG